jgi:hypothetical protein
MFQEYKYNEDFKTKQKLCIDFQNVNNLAEKKPTPVEVGF